MSSRIVYEMFARIACLVLLTAAWLISADTYNGPVPPKPDVPYILHADRLVETESAQAREDNHKGDTTFVISGAASPARTPLAEPIFILQPKSTSAERYEMYKMEVKNGNREITMSQKRRRNGPRPIHIMVTRLSGGLYKIEADEPLENGEYSLSPSDSNRAFCFEVY